MCSYDGVDTGRKLEDLEQEICQLASHIHAATCRWLRLLSEFDRREGWAAWGCRSCAHWVSWRCGMAPASARERVRVARCLDALPLIASAFGEGRLSYSKVRALTRVGDVVEEAELLDLARHATAAQLERLVRACRGARAAETNARGRPPQRWVAWSYEDDGSLTLRGKLPAEEGAIVVAALEAAAGHVREEAASVSAEAAGVWTAVGDGVSAETPGERAGAGEIRADALLMLAEADLASSAMRSGGDRYQVVVHVDETALRSEHAPLEVPRRCELDDGVPIAAETARRVACDASLVPLLAGSARSPDVGRKRRTIPPALRRALSSRDRGCRFPGCGARRFVDAHHVRHWADGGPTSMANLVQLCRHHHRLLHEGGFTVAGHPARELVFRRPDGRRIAAAPRPPRGRRLGVVPGRRGPRVAADACVSLSAGERLDLDLGVEALLAWTREAEAELGVREAIGV